MAAELSDDKTAFRYKLKSVTYNYSIAKTKKNYDYIDAGLEIKFKALVLNKSQYEVKDLRGTTLIIPMIHVGNTYTVDGSASIYSGWIPFPQKPTIEQTAEITERETKTVVTDIKKGGTLSPQEENKQVTTSSKRAKDVIILNKLASLYEIEINVIETNPYKIKAENKQKLIEENADNGTALLKVIAEILFKEKKDEKEEKEE